jgi:hypothetical protein
VGRKNRKSKKVGQKNRNRTEGGLLTEEGEQKGDRKIGIVRTCGSRTVSCEGGCDRETE